MGTVKPIKSCIIIGTVVLIALDLLRSASVRKYVVKPALMCVLNKEKNVSNKHATIIKYQKIGQGSLFSTKLSGIANINHQHIKYGTTPSIIQGARKPYFLDHLNGLSVRYPMRGSFIMFHMAKITNASPKRATGKPISTS